MGEDHEPTDDQVPEGDLLEQRTPLGPSAVADPEAALDDPDPTAGLDDEAALVNEADRLDQDAVLDEAEEDYPHDASGAASS